MDLAVEWQPPMVLADGAKQNLIYTCDLAKLPAAAGVYVFGRQYGKQVEALYVGKAQSLRGRLKTQLKNLPLMKHMEAAKNGHRVLVVGRFKPKRGQQQATCIKLIERALIRYFLSEGHDLVNIQGAKLRQHTVNSIGAKGMVPKAMLLDRQGRQNSN